MRKTLLLLSKIRNLKKYVFFQTSLIRNIIRFYRLMKLNKAKYNINRETHTNFYVLKNGITQE